MMLWAFLKPDPVHSHSIVSEEHSEQNEATSNKVYGQRKQQLSHAEIIMVPY